MNPRVTAQNSTSVNLQVEGVGFNPNSVVRFDNTDLPTRFVSNTRLTAAIDSRMLRSPGSYSVYVVNPGSGGGISSVVYFLVNFRP